MASAKSEASCTLRRKVLSMAVLNENLDWNQITAMRPDVRQAFRGVPVKTLVPKGELLCRFITTESKKKGITGNETFRSPWWMNNGGKQ